MVVATLGMVVALLLGKAGFDEMLVLGIRGGLVQPFWAGIAGIVVALLVGLAAIALWRGWRATPRLAFAAGALSIGFHVYGALPPHRNVGILGAALGVGYGVVLLVAARRRLRGAALAGRAG